MIHRKSEIFQPLCSMKNLEKSNKVYDTYSMGNNSPSTI